MQIHQTFMADANKVVAKVAHALNETTIRQPEEDLNIYKLKNPVDVPIVKSEITTYTASPNFVRFIEFEVSGADLVSRNLPGQTLGVIANEKVITGGQTRYGTNRSVH